MGYTHAWSGAVGWLGLVPVAAAAAPQLSPVGVVAAGTVLTMGAAVLPDIDHPSATPARTLGPVTKVLSTLVHALSGGHRRGTHTLLFIVAMFPLGWALGTFAPPAAAAVIFLLAAWCFRSSGLNLPIIKRLGVVAPIVQAGLFTWVVWQYLPHSTFPLLLGVAMSLGSLIHCLGDQCTAGGIAWFLPASQKRFILPGAPTTDGLWERFVAAGFVLGAVALFWWRVGEPWTARQDWWPL